MRPTSPQTMLFVGSGFLRSEEVMAAAMARSEAGSLSLMPPTMLMKMS